MDEYFLDDLDRIIADVKITHYPLDYIVYLSLRDDDDVVEQLMMEEVFERFYDQDFIPCVADDFVVLECVLDITSLKEIIEETADFLLIGDRF